MRKSLMALYGAAALVAFTPAAHAVDFEPGDTGFEVSGDINSGPVTASVGRSGIGLGDFTDNFFFIIDQNGLGSGSAPARRSSETSPILTLRPSRSTALKPRSPARHRDCSKLHLPKASTSYLVRKTRLP